MQISVNWKFYTYSVKGECMCKECGRKITKTFSVQYREDCEPDKESCAKAKNRWLSEEHLCNKCKNKKLNKNYEKVNVNFYTIEHILHNIGDAQKELKKIVDSYKEQLVGTVALYKDSEYLITNIYYSYPCQVFLELQQIHKNKPWILTNKTANYNIDRNEIIFTNERFKDREVL